MAGYIGSKASVVSSGAERKKTFTITGATTSLTGLNYTVGKVHVFQNGVRLVDGTDYTATNGTTITLTVAAQSGDNVVVISQAAFQVALSGIDDQSNATAITIDSSERVMIGTTTEGQETADNLTIADTGHCGITLRSGASSVGTIFFSDATSGADEYVGYVQYNHADNYMKWQTNGAERMRIDSSGNVGINASDPQGSIHVRRTGTASLILEGDTNNSGDTGQRDVEILMLTDGGAGNDPFGGTTYGAHGYRISTQNLSGQTALSFDEWHSSLGFLSRFHIDASGNVGINTNSVVTSTGTNLQVTCTTGNARLILDNTTTNGKEYRIYSGGAGELSFYNTDSNTERARIISEGAFQASHNGSYRTWGGNIVGHQMVSNLNNNVCFTADAENSSFQSDVQRILCNRGASVGYDFLVCTSGNLGDDEFKLRGDGQAYTDGAWNTGGADYAEYFETTTGNTIPRGTTVVLDNNKVRAATSDDLASSIIGVIRPKDDGQISAMVGNAGWSKWGEKYLTDDFGVYLTDDHNVISFDGKSYESHKVPDDVTIPDDAVTTTHDGNGLKFKHRRENPDYDSSLTYSPREDRDEWVIVGLLGQVRILGGQPTGDRWIKMRDISETVEEWFVR